MIIKSKFSDYYDGGLVNGIDSDRHYIRETKEVEFKTQLDLRKFEIIGFCGEIYPIINESYKSYGKWIRHPKDYILFNEDAVLNEYIVEKKNNEEVYIKHNVSQHSYFSFKGENRRSFVENLKNNKELKGLFTLYNTPVFHIKQPRIGDWRHRKKTLLTINPCLSDLSFYKIKDTIQAFQDIEIFIGNVLTGIEDKPQPVGSDLDLLKSKGFDSKWSFRKEKEV